MKSSLSIGSNENRSSRPEANGRTFGQSREGQRREEVDAGAAEGKDVEEVEGGHHGRSSRRYLQVRFQRLKKIVPC